MYQYVKKRGRQTSAVDEMQLFKIVFMNDPLRARCEMIAVLPNDPQRGAAKSDG
jgi:hypothetical protein